MYVGFLRLPDLSATGTAKKQTILRTSLGGGLWNLINFKGFGGIAKFAFGA
jgi:hypothetical protein